MEIHVVKPGDTLFQIARMHGVPMSRLIEDNQLPNPARLVVGQTIVVQTPETIRTVRPGDTLESIALAEHTTPRQLLRDNPALSRTTSLSPGQQLVIAYHNEKAVPILISAFPSLTIEQSLLEDILPYLTQVSLLSFQFSSAGNLISQSQQPGLEQPRALGAIPHLRIFSEGRTNQEENTVHAMLSSPAARNRLTEQILVQAGQLGVQGVDVDIPTVAEGDGALFADFIQQLKETLSAREILLAVALPPKIDPLSYAGYDYAALGRRADILVLMTGRWIAGEQPPMPVAPISPLEQAICYALSQIPPQKLLLGIPSHGNDWLLPHQPGRSPTEISNPQAVDLAARYYAAIRYHDRYQAPWFRYGDHRGQEHEVWFEDARSIHAKLELVEKYSLLGVNYWRFVPPFPQNWRLLNALFQIKDGS